MNFDILIPTQEAEVAYQLIEYAESVFETTFAESKRIAKAIADAKYWEAYDCGDDLRQEYWRLVKLSFDSINNFKEKSFST